MRDITKHNIKYTQGFTLIELVFATTLLGIMLTLILSTFIGVFRFYVWAGTTRVNQEYSRQLIDDISRTIQSKKITSVGASSICLSNYDTEPIGSTKIQLDGTVVNNYSYSVIDCSGAATSTKVISNPNMKVNILNFVIIYGAYNNVEPAATLKKSATIQMTTTNGVVDPTTLKCRVGDNFCDQATFNTAASER
jgi:prepilin-type N-terminal cleavage/methylation domain-containing protein